MASNTSNGFSLESALEQFRLEVEALGLKVSKDDDGAGLGALGFGDVGQNQRGTVERKGGPINGFRTTGETVANAKVSFDDAAAYGLMIALATVSAGTVGRADDRFTGTATVNGSGKAEGRGLSIGLQEFLDPDEDDSEPPPGEDEEDFGPGPEDFLPQFAGHVDTGGGGDLLKGGSTVIARADEELIFAASNGLIVDRGSLVMTGNGSDTLEGVASLRVFGPAVGDNDQDGPSAGDADLEVIGDGVENIGLIDLGNGDDVIEAHTKVRSLSGATAIADGLDSSSVGSPDPVGGELDEGARILAGAGMDTINASARSLARGDAAIANGLDTRSLIDMGDGNDLLSLSARATFIDTADAVGEQEEAIADGMENRGTIILGAGNDTVTATAIAKGNGVLTIADGLDTRGDPGINPEVSDRGISIDAGTGNDLIKATGIAVATAPLDGPENDTQQAPKTIASGLLTENSVAGTVTMGGGADTVTLRGVASGLGTDTAAFGLANISFDIPNPTVRAKLDLGAANDVLVARAVANGSELAAAYGVWGGETIAQDGDDNLTAVATLSGASRGEAAGFRIDDDFSLFGATDSGNTPITSSEGALVVLGAGDDTLTGRASAREDVVTADVAGIFVGEDGVLDAGNGNDVIRGVGNNAAQGRVAAIAGEETG
ncbi:MAG: hypothetical protein AAGB11_18530, partial [Pseudomonadota bacterium]